MRKVLQEHIDKTIGINCEKPFKVESAKLIYVGDDYFSIVDSKKGYTHHFTYFSIVQITEGPTGIDVGGLFSHKDSFSIVVKVGHILQYVPA